MIRFARRQEIGDPLRQARRRCVAGACAALVAVALVTSGGAADAAQSDVVFTTLGIDLWPDYDRPGVLVIYRGTIAPGASLPATLELRIPAAAGPPNAVAERRAEGQLVSLQFERRVDGDTAVITATVTRPVLQMEYYDPAIERDGAAHSFTFRWPGDYEVGALTVSVQQPDLAQNLTTEPAAAGRGPGSDGLIYHNVALGAVEAGQSVAVNVRYEKASDQLTVETMPQVETAPPPAAATSQPGSDTEVVVIVVVALLVAALVTVALLVTRSRRAVPSAGQGGGAVPPGATSGARFCTQCGAAAAAGDRFCHGCGSALR